MDINTDFNIFKEKNCTVVMKTTFELNFDLYQAFKQHGYTKIWKQTKAVNSKSISLITCKLVIRKTLLTIKT